jgi:hypothetical protein
VVVRQDLTAEQRGRIGSYQVGDVLRFVRPGGNIEAGERARVVSTDEKKNLLRLQLETSHLVRVINPKERRAFEIVRMESGASRWATASSFGNGTAPSTLRTEPSERSRSSTTSGVSPPSTWPAGDYVWTSRSLRPSTTPMR